MKLTQEQEAIIKSSGNIKINAVAGSGKTTTVIEYAKTRPKDAKILYLVFNKSVKQEAVKKFADKGLDNVKVETAHSLAYKRIVFKYNYKIRAQGYKTHEIVEILGIQGAGEKHAEYIIANHINKFIAYFCNSDKLKVQNLNYLDVVSDEQAIKFVTTFYKYIEKQSRLFLSKMDKGEIEITHDFYLKKFQLSNPQLGYDYILFDEGQDASPAMLDIFLKQDAIKVIVGDTHQQIYGWRFAVNSLEKVGFKTYHLSTSFRFGQDIANLAARILDWKTHIDKHKIVIIKGKGATKKTTSKAVIARTNLSLLLKAIEYVTEKKEVNKIYFEGNINSYTYADEGASLYDVLSLYNGKRSMIKDKLLTAMKDMDELEEYIEKTEDVQLGMMVDIVKEYGSEIPRILKSIKEKHVDDDKKHEAQIVFSTVHRCKGMEYDAVQIVPDFITETKLEKQQADIKSGAASKPKLIEEINLLYVAVTRAKYSLHISENFMPKEFPASQYIHVMKVERTEAKKDNAKSYTTIKPKPKESNPAKPIKEKTYTVSKVREEKKEAYKPWSWEDDAALTELCEERMSARDIAQKLERTWGAIKARIKKLGLDELYG